MNRRNFTLSVLLGATTLSLGANQATKAQPASGMSAGDYLAMASKGSTFLEQTAIDGYSKSGHPALRRFATAEIREQQMLAAKLTRATGVDAAATGQQSLLGAALGVPFAVAGSALSLLGVPLTSDGEKSATIARLRSTPAGPAYDAAFVNAQITGHNEAFAIHGTYARSGDNPALRRIAAGALPLIRTHLAQLARLQRAVGAAA
jgi:predicted outer membrane protein